MHYAKFETDFKFFGSIAQNRRIGYDALKKWRTVRLAPTYLYLPAAQVQVAQAWWAPRKSRPTLLANMVIVLFTFNTYGLRS